MDLYPILNTNASFKNANKCEFYPNSNLNLTNLQVQNHQCILITEFKIDDHEKCIPINHTVKKHIVFIVLLYKIKRDLIFGMENSVYMQNKLVKVGSFYVSVLVGRRW